MYPKVVTIENDKLKDLLKKKGDLVNIGRSKSEEIEVLEKTLEEIDQKIQAEEKKINIDDLLEKEKEQTLIVEKCIEKMKEIKKEIYDRMIPLVPKELHDEYDETKKKLERLEEERNKVALKAQKFNDKIIPLAKQMMKPFLQDQYDDYDTLKLDGDEIVATIFNHLTDWKNNFKRRQ